MSEWERRPDEDIATALQLLEERRS